MDNTDISRSNGTDTLTVSAASPLFDLLDHIADTMTTRDLLDTLQAYAAHVEEATERAVNRARSEGQTWDAIGTALEMTRQGAQQRYRR